METGFLIKNGLLVDGTGVAPYSGDIRVTGDRITEIGTNLERRGRERVIDAQGCHVTPGFIEPHNHFDGPMWWLPAMEPMSGYGITTTVNGHCGFSAAPVHDDPRVREEMVRIFSFFEDIPEEPFSKLLPWDWSRWSEYRASMERRVRLPVNYAALVGHIAIRLAVMGLEAWDRAATPAEVGRMCELLDDALSAGALGLSSNLLDHDENDRPVPTWKADDAEWSALMDVIASHPDKILQVNVDYIVRFSGGASIKRIASIARGKGIRIQFLGAVVALDFALPLMGAAKAAYEQLKAEGLDVWNGFNHSPITTVINFNSSLYWAQTNNYPWGEIIQAKDEDAKFALLADPEWRSRGRQGWADTVDQSPAKYPENVCLFESESGAGPVGITLKDYMDQRQIDHPSDALAEWVLDNGSASMLRLANIGRADALLAELFKDPNGVGNISDAGAHGQMFCGTGTNILLLTEFVRDQGMLKIEEAVHILSGNLARHYGLHDRGVLAVGKRADIVVFNLDELELRPEHKQWDVPDGKGSRTYRLTRDPAPVRLTLVNGQATFDNGSFTGRFSGEFIGERAREMVAA